MTTATTTPMMRGVLSGTAAGGRDRFHMWLDRDIFHIISKHIGMHADGESCDRPTWYSDLLRYRRGFTMLVSDSDSDRVGPWIKGYLLTTTDGSGQVGNREGLLSCLPSAAR